MSLVFVTSSGTEVGKTFISSLLIRQLRAQGRHVAALKPVISGWSETPFAATDTGELIAALGRDADEALIDEVSPWRFDAALSPDMAAAREGRAIDYDALVALCRQRAAAAEDVLLVEGVGGVMVPLDERHTVLDWIADLTVNPLLVVGSYLGTISHTLTACEALERRGFAPSAIVISESEVSPVPLEETKSAIARFRPDTPIVAVPRSRGGAEAALAAAPDLTLIAGA